MGVLVREGGAVPVNQERIWACCGDRLFDGERVRSDHAVIVQGTVIADIVPAGNLPGDMQRHAVPGARSCRA